MFWFVLKLLKRVREMGSPQELQGWQLRGAYSGVHQPRGLSGKVTLGGP